VFHHLLNVHVQLANKKGLKKKKKEYMNTTLNGGYFSSYADKAYQRALGCNLYILCSFDRLHA
jgi:hypothetical protein